MSNPIAHSTFAGRSLETTVLQRYRLQEPVSCRHLTGGVNDTYLVTTGDGRYFLRLYRSHWRRKRDVEAEVAMLDHLARHDHPVSRPVPRVDQTHLTRLTAPEGVRWAVLFSDAPGKPPEYYPATCRRYGVIVGRMHECLDQRPVDDRRFHLDFTHLLDDPLRHLEPFLQDERDDFQFLVTLSDRCKARISALLPTVLPEYGCCHGDHHGYNVHQDEHGQMRVFDFDCYGYGWRAYDVAVFRWQAAHWYGFVPSGMAQARRRWNAFLQGYSETRILTEAELDSVRFFVAIRHIWWMGIHMYMRQREAWSGVVPEGFFEHNIGWLRQWASNHRLC